MRDRDVGVGCLAALHAGNEVAVMLHITCLAMHLFHHLAAALLHHQPAAVTAENHQLLLAVDLNARGILLPVRNQVLLAQHIAALFHVGGILAHVKRHGESRKLPRDIQHVGHFGVILLVGDIAAAQRAHALRQAGIAHHHQGQINLMDAVVRHVAPAIIPVPMPAAAPNALVIRAPRGTPQPAVPVETRRLLTGVAQFEGRAVLEVEDLDQTDRTKLPALHDLARPEVVCGRTVLRADLYDAPVLGRGLDHLPALPHAVRMRLFDIDVLAGLARLDRQRRMPVVVGCDDDRIDVLGLQYFSVVFFEARLVRLHRLNERPHLIHALVAQVADRRTAGTGLLKHHAQDEPAAAAASDDRDIDPFVRAGHAVRAQRLPRAEPRRRAGGAPQEAAPRASPNPYHPLHVMLHSCPSVNERASACHWPFVSCSARAAGSMPAAANSAARVASSRPSGAGALRSAAPNCLRRCMNA